MVGRKRTNRAQVEGGGQIDHTRETDPEGQQERPRGSWRREAAVSSWSQTGSAGPAEPLRLALACAPRISLEKEEGVGAGGGNHGEPEAGLGGRTFPLHRERVKAFTWTPSTALTTSFVGKIKLRKSDDPRQMVFQS